MKNSHLPPQTSTRPVRLHRRLCKENNIEAGCVLSSVGSLTHATLRLANRNYYMSMTVISRSSP
ncbi:MAG: hypothetical protein IPJ47_12275 [Anaerolineales bacterium]|nr:hypothetical protein [Anaerolineales bacterium]